MLIKALFVTLTITQIAFAQNPVMVSVPGGSFTMGDRSGVGSKTERPLRTVQIKGFEMMATEVTFAQFDKFCDMTWRKKTEDLGWGRGDTLPVVGVSWYDAVLYANWLSAEHGYTPCYTINKTEADPNNEALQDVEKWTISCNWDANGYRLPTEAEWEYAARGGQANENFSGAGSNYPDSIASYAVNSKFRTGIVAKHKANRLGLFDMTGNVSEWCYDWYADEYNPTQTDNPTGPEGGNRKVIRGGNWSDPPYLLRISHRDSKAPQIEMNDRIGFRLVRRP